MEVTQPTTPSLEDILGEPLFFDVDMSEVPTVAPKIAVFPDHKQAYGLRFGLELPDWLIELKLYAKNDEYKAKQERAGRPVQVLDKWKHFIHWALHFYGPGRPAQFIWHPWAVRMIRACCLFNRVGFAGASSCGKSEFGGLWVIGNLLADHWHTLNIVTTKNLREAEGRVWGSVKKYYDGMPAGIDGVVTKYIQHPTPQVCSIRNGKRAGNAGIKLIPADASQGSTKTNKLQGTKAHKNRKAKSRMFLFGDEYTELSHALGDTLESNLSNNDEFHAIAAANPMGKQDPFGIFVKPAHGWGSIHVNMDWWQIKNGICLHFDALNNPNWIAKKNIWPIQRYEKVVEQIEESGGKDTPRFWRNCRAFWPPVGVEDSGVVSDAEITQFGADEKFFGEFKGGVSRWAGVDTAFAEGGDRCIMMIAQQGKNEENVDVIELVEYHQLTADTNNTKDSIELQVARQIISICNRMGIPPENLGVDATGAGAAFCAILQGEWELNSFHRVQFGATATDRPVSDLDDTPAKEKYFNRAAEIAFYVKELLRHKQIYGIQWGDLCLEMTTRRHTTAKSSAGNTVIRIEDKRQYKKRTGQSPDISDALNVCLDTIRERGKFRGEQTRLQDDQRGPENFHKFVQSRNVVLKANNRLSHTRSGNDSPHKQVFARLAKQPTMRRLKSW